MRSGSATTSSWQSAPPVSLPISVTSSRSSASMIWATRAASPLRREVGVRLQRQLVRAERQVGDDAAEAVAQALDDRLPQAAVDQRAVDEEERRAGALVAVADGPLLQCQLGHRVRPSR